MLLIGLFTLLMAIALYSYKMTSVLYNRIAIIILLYSGLLTINTLSMTLLNTEIGLYGGLFHVTTITHSFDVFILLIAGVILLLNEFPFKLEMINKTTYFVTKDKHDVKETSISLPSLPLISEYSLVGLFSVCGASLLISSNDLMSMYLSIELQSFSVYILASVYRESESATSAGLKYFLLGGLSSGFILLGSSLLYGFTGLTNFEDLTIFSATSNFIIRNITDTTTVTVLKGNMLEYFYNDEINILQLSVFIVIIGFLFKVAAAPFHNWAPDVYDGVPTIVTTWLSIMPKISIFIFLLQSNLKSIMQLVELNNVDLYQFTYISSWATFLTVSGGLSLIIGTVLGLAQYRLKRLLAYSTISHVGFILLALSISSEESIESFLFYLIQYTVTNLNTFFILIAFGYLISIPIQLSYLTTYEQVLPKDFIKYSKNYKLSSEYSFYSPVQFISQLRGQFRENPLLSLSFAICLFSMAGIPPLIGFFAKQMVLYSALHEGYFFLSLIAIITSVISAAYYLRIVNVLYFQKRSDNHLLFNNDQYILKLNYIHCFIIAVLTLILVLFVVNPTPLLNSVHILTLSLFYY